MTRAPTRRAGVAFPLPRFLTDGAGTDFPNANQPKGDRNLCGLGEQKTAMRKWLVGCGVLIVLGLVVCGGALGWLLRAPDLEIPPRQYPPNNAYEEYRQIGEAMRRRLDNDARFNQIESALSRARRYRLPTAPTISSNSRPTCVATPPSLRVPVSW